MTVPIRANPVLLILLSACGGVAESPVRVADAPSVTQLQGQWQRSYITAGAVSMNSSLRFESDGTFTLDSVSMTSFTEPPVVGHYQGSYHGTERGTVQYEWATDDGRVEAENNLTFVVGRALEHRCCAKRAATERWWSHRGYLATNAEQTTFKREADRREFSADGTLRSSLRTQVDLTVSKAPARLVGQGDGTLEVAVLIEAVGVEIKESHSFRHTFPCQVQADGDGMLVISLPGWDRAEGASLIEYPYRAPQQWTKLLAQEADTTGWSESARSALQDAFEPYLAFDEAQPNVLFEHIDWDSLKITGYARVED